MPTEDRMHRDDVPPRNQLNIMGKVIQPNPRFEKFGPPKMKIPRWISLHEDNVILQFTVTGVIAAGGAWNIAAQPGRECVVRRVFITDFLAGASFSVETLTLGTENLAPSNATVPVSMPGLMFSPLNLNPPDFDLPMTTAQSIIITGTNRSAANASYLGGANID